MKRVNLIRVSYTPKGTFGVLLDEEDLPFAITVERPWNNNIRGESCIPEGEYMCIRHISSKFGETFEVLNVPGRTAILFHKGNISDDSHGCIIVGEQFYFRKDGMPSVISSKEGFNEFMYLLRFEDEFKLVIKKG